MKTTTKIESLSPVVISRRERQVLYLVAYEYTSLEIAEELFISNHTVFSHRKKLMAKLGVTNTAGLVRRGFELGLLTVPVSRAMVQERA